MASRQFSDRDGSARGQIDKQIVLPWSKAVEISAKGIRVRFWRSIITMGSIILAIAFLASILANTTIIGSLRKAANNPAIAQQERAKINLRLQAEGADVKEKRSKTADDNPNETPGEMSQAEHDRLVQQGFLAGLYDQLTARDKWLVVLALLVCFVGIINAMLMSVTERFREIGTMKCLGALDSFIVKLFLLEASFQGVVGTVLGIVLGTLLSIFRAMYAYSPTYTLRYFPFKGLVMSGLLALAAGSVISIVAALFPARAAARMQPVDALRSEQ